MADRYPQHLSIFLKKNGAAPNIDAPPQAQASMVGTCTYGWASMVGASFFCKKKINFWILGGGQARPYMSTSPEYANLAKICQSRRNIGMVAPVVLFIVVVKGEGEDKVREKVERIYTK